MHLGFAGGEGLITWAGGSRCGGASVGHLGTSVPPSEGEEGESGRNLQNNITSVFVLLELNKNQKGPGRLVN